MAEQDPGRGPPSKRRKLDLDFASEAGCTPPPTDTQAAETLAGLNRPISPPASRRKRSRTPTPATPRVEADAHVTKQSALTPPRAAQTNTGEEKEAQTRYVPSPIQLTRIRDLAPHQNVDTVGLKEILGDPMIKECWNFNFLFDLDFVMQQFDLDVKDLVKVKIIHGFWKREDERRIALMEAAERYPNVELISAYIPDPFGTHHSKMLVLFRHDDLAQIIIHTANMISRDWGNMTQAVWRSPLLPLESQDPTSPNGQTEPEAHPIGSGERFKTDLLCYLNAYGKRLRGLTKQLSGYDFSAARAAFIASAPSRQKPSTAKSSIQTSFGWLGLQEILSTIPVRRIEDSSPPNIVIQISSIATLGQAPTWLTHFQSVLSRSSSASATQTRTATTAASPSKAANFFTKRDKPALQSNMQAPDPTFKIIFPTPDEIRTSLDGYNSGGSIHTKVQSAAQQKQLQYLRPVLCHWKYSLQGSASDATPTRREAHRGPAAPHIKTYIRFSDAAHKSIDWAMVTSANLSTQAWGLMENKKEEVWIQSWETGVVVWPQLYETSGIDTVMVPTFGKDMPGPEDGSAEDVAGDEGVQGAMEGAKIVVGFRMPYDLPLSPYDANEVPWCASSAHEEPDWKGQKWPGY